MYNAWVDGEEELRDERMYTPWAEPGWLSWNAFSPEQQFCSAVADFIKYSEPSVVIETGAGQGYLTRRCAPLCGDYRVYEADDTFRNTITEGKVQPLRSPTKYAMSDADVVILDSGMDYRIKEIGLWASYGKTSSIVFIHDAGNGHGQSYTHSKYLKAILDNGLSGIRTANPRGGFIGWHKQPDPETKEFLADLLPLMK